MISSARQRSRPSGASRWTWVGLILTLLAPLTVLVAIVGLKAGLIPIEIAYDTMTMLIGLGLAGLGVLGAILALIGGAMAFRQSWLIAVVAVVISVATVSLFVREIQAHNGVLTSKADPSYKPGAGVSTDAVDQVGFSTSIMAERKTNGAASLVSGVGPNGCDIAHLPMQSAPGAAGYALQEAGFDIRDLGVNRANGVYTTTWFDRTYDAAIRIRPGRTDIRVAPRDGAHDGGTSCRLAKRILLELQPAR
ncbi:hypothetical protein BH10PSE1_BH10PSE1_32370 [soil metagenome]